MLFALVVTPVSKFGGWVVVVAGNKCECRISGGLGSNPVLNIKHHCSQAGAAFVGEVSSQTFFSRGMVD